MVIETPEDHAEAIREIKRLWGADVGTPDGDLLTRLIDDAIAYEDIHWPIGNPDVND